MPLQLYNTLTRTVEPFVPADPACVTFYTCGPTVYDDAHIGNFRSFLAADLLRRWIESPLCELANDQRPEAARANGRRVVHVMNITDVGHMTDDDTADGAGEDKMQAAERRLLESKKSGTAHAGAAAEVDPRDPRSIADFYASRFIEDATRLGLKVVVEAAKDPTLLPRATHNVPGMIAMIERLIERGFAYRAGDAVYFDVQKFSSYGRLSGNSLDELRGGAGGRVSAENQASKRHPADFLLWKADATHLMKWDSPWGAGYPGWHIECSVMSLGRLVPGGLERVFAQTGAAGGGAFEIDLHSGGEDNIFPHHECERAQSCACTGSERFARHWFHARFLLVEGEKMSKSKGNFFTARDLFAKGHEPAAVRFELLKTHYRANANFTEQGLRDARKRIEFYQRVARYVSAAMQDPELARANKFHTLLLEKMQQFTDAMHSDLNIAGALGVLNTGLGIGWVSSEDATGPRDRFESLAEKQTLPEQPLAPNDAFTLFRDGVNEYERTWGALHLVDSVLGVVFHKQARSVTTEIALFTGVEPSAEVESLLAERRDAKKAKDFARADAIRDQLAARGLAIKDVAGGKVEVSRA